MSISSYKDSQKLVRIMQIAEGISVISNKIVSISWRNFIVIL